MLVCTVFELADCIATLWLVDFHLFKAGFICFIFTVRVFGEPFIKIARAEGIFFTDILSFSSLSSI